MSFPNESLATLDPTVGSYFTPGSSTTPGSWRGDRVIANVQQWNPVNNITSSSSNPQTTHLLSSAFWIVIAENTRLASLNSHSNTRIVLDRDASAGGAL